MDKEFLLSLGLNDQQLEKILQQHQTSLAGFIPKHRFEEINNKAKQLEHLIAERDNQLENLQKSKQSADELKATIEELKTNNTAKVKELEGKYTKAVKKAACLSHLKEAHDAELVFTLLQDDSIALQDDGTIKGLDDQLSKIRAEKPFLFKSTDIKGQPPYMPPKVTLEGRQEVNFGKKIAAQNNATTAKNLEASKKYFGD